jgi:hypothetical protein
MSEGDPSSDPLLFISKRKRGLSDRALETFQHFFKSAFVIRCWIDTTSEQLLVVLQIDHAANVVDGVVRILREAVRTGGAERTGRRFRSGVAERRKRGSETRVRNAGQKRGSECTFRCIYNGNMPITPSPFAQQSRPNSDDVPVQPRSEGQKNLRYLTKVRSDPCFWKDSPGQQAISVPVNNNH